VGFLLLKGSVMSKLGKTEILDRFYEIHKGLYEYYDFDYIDRHQKISIVCGIHGEFKQQVRKHLEGQGCKRCAGTTTSSKWVNPTGYREACGKQVQYQEYTIWRAMTGRCKPSYWAKHTHYTGTTVSELFSSWDDYKDWYDKQFNSSFVDDEGKVFELDKDLLSNGSRHYSEDTCCFLPRAINHRLQNKSLGLKKLIEQYKDKLDPRAYQALMSYQINIDD
jgi:hypothetical protein